MSKRIITAFLLLVSITAASAGSFFTGQKVTAPELNSALDTKTDNAAAAITGGTVSGTAISGGTISGAVISGSTVTGSPISGGSISGSTLDNTPIGNTTPSTGTFSSLSVTTPNPSLFYQLGATGSVVRTLLSRLQDTVSVFDFMSAAHIADVKSGTLIDETAEIDAACAASVGQRLHFPAGKYLYSGSCALGTGQVISGDGRDATIIYAATANASSLFNAAGYGSGLQHLAFKANVTQTGGSYVLLTGPESYITDFFMDGDYNGIDMTGNVSRIRHGRFQNGAVNATRIVAGGGDNSQVIDDVLMGAQSPQVCRAGIEVKNSFALTIGNTSVLQQGTALLIDPSSSAESVGSLYVHDSFFDYSSSNNIKISASGTGSVVRSRFANVWAGDGATDSVSITNYGTGAISGIHFVSPHLILNTGAGMTTGGTVTDLSIDGGEIAQNSYGLYFNAGLSNVHVNGAMIGAGGGMTGNTNQAIVLSAGVNNILVTNNDLTGNGVSPPISDGTAVGTTKIIKNNLGYNPIPNTVITVGTSPFTWTNNTGDTVVVYISGGTVSGVTTNGNTVASATNTSVTVPQGSSVVTTYSVAPTMSYNGF